MLYTSHYLVSNLYKPWNMLSYGIIAFSASLNCDNRPEAISKLSFYQVHALIFAYST